MAFIAQRQLKVIPKGTDDVILYQPGDVIPDFDKWNEVAKRAHLNLNYVKDDPSYVAPTVKKIATKVAATKTAAPKAAKKAKLAKTAQALAAPAEEAVETKPCENPDEDVIYYACPRCPDKKFLTTKALSTHVTLAHTKKG